MDRRSSQQMGELPLVPPGPTPLLSPRQLLVVQLLAIGMSTTQIAAVMSISVNTVRTRARDAVRKLGADDRQGVVQTARDHGLVYMGWSGGYEQLKAPLAEVS